MADLFTREPIERVDYSERYTWERGTHDVINQSLSQYYKAAPVWVFVQTMAGGVDGRRSLAHASLVRKYLAHCDTWTSSYRFVLEMLQDLAVTPQFLNKDLNTVDPAAVEETRKEAIWDVFFTRVGGLQEYGFHAGIEELMWAPDQLNGGLSTLNWGVLVDELNQKAPQWTNLIIKRATDAGGFFPLRPPREPFEVDSPPEE